MNGVRKNLAWQSRFRRSDPCRSRWDWSSSSCVLHSLNGTGMSIYEPSQWTFTWIDGFRRTVHSQSSLLFCSFIFASIRCLEREDGCVLIDRSPYIRLEHVGGIGLLSCVNGALKFSLRQANGSIDTHDQRSTRRVSHMVAEKRVSSRYLVERTSPVDVY